MKPPITVGASAVRKSEEKEDFMKSREDGSLEAPKTLLFQRMLNYNEIGIKRPCQRATQDINLSHFHH